MNTTAALRDLPSIERLLSDPTLADVIQRCGRQRCKQALQAMQQRWRNTRQPPTWAIQPSAYAEPLKRALGSTGYRRVFNLSGTLIHTNLGRAPLSDTVLEQVLPLLRGPTNLEFDLSRGQRGQRDRSVADRFCALTGAEACTLVNNCAAALVLVLNTFALNKDVPVSRGELIEIGGSFRLPDIMRQAGAVLQEVGTTNRTHRLDYESAITERTGLLLKVHPSNYEVSGFRAEAPLKDLAELAQRARVPLCEDLGSGALVDLSAFGLPPEPKPQDSLRQGVDLVLFSGDKLLGGPQAGIILGKTSLIEALNRNPLKRALRLDKVALALLDETLKLYETPENLAELLPIFRCFQVTDEELAARALRLETALSNLPDHVRCERVETTCQVGSGAQPSARLQSLALRLTTTSGMNAAKLLDALRRLETPVIGRIQQDAVWLDLRTAEPLDDLAAVLSGLAGELERITAP
ncbi:MAG: L-seryl-tRNA(Sec) selenium transferase [Pseudomonadota bacterium]